MSTIRIQVSPFYRSFIKGSIDRQRARCLLPVRGCGGKIYFFQTKSKFAVDKGHPVC
ncbi:hypothetical protein FAEPRAM212_01032 [Faecalibacterium prausnitzii M21/2]|uniref:Uncharacterized protein n=1 Tax=Faecalibacterium prausnitzii M21/2 TaxID=411485 RepID=A8S9E2_9FIRM|nr:hypothetical protein FAEPRAM212_01032 [Faecalibacterium prausnitzii M21/2]